MAISLAWLGAEAVHQGLDLAEQDLIAIGRCVEEVRVRLKAIRPTETEGLNSPYQFIPAP